MELNVNEKEELRKIIKEQLIVLEETFELMSQKRFCDKIAKFSAQLFDSLSEVGFSAEQAISIISNFKLNK